MFWNKKRKKVLIFCIIEFFIFIIISLILGIVVSSLLFIPAIFFVFIPIFILVAIWVAFIFDILWLFLMKYYIVKRIIWMIIVNFDIYFIVSTAYIIISFLSNSEIDKKYLIVLIINIVISIVVFIYSIITFIKITKYLISILKEKKLV